ncbi:MAG: hypothetical protein OEM82_01885 [Acidobacteriota bacterium]|nr:hypothetical protein [Acidobacteriota bacterium]MDH3529342.1 hypothetical protein [Acidobacteriota bacterium]
MLKNVLGVIVAYIFVAVFTIICLFGVYGVMGTDWAFKPESFEASTGWSIASIIFGFIGALISGRICLAISKSKGAVKFLAAVFIVLGMSLAVYTMMQPKPTEKRPAEMTFMAAGEQAYSPDWYNFAIPLVGAAGALIGGGALKKDEKREDG